MRRVKRALLYHDGTYQHLVLDDEEDWVCQRICAVDVEGDVVFHMMQFGGAGFDIVCERVSVSTTLWGKMG